MSLTTPFNILEYTLPKKECVTALIPKVYRPIVTYMDTITSTNYTDFFQDSTDSFFSLNNSLFALRQDWAGTYTLSEYNTTTNKFISSDVINIPNYKCAVIIPTTGTKIYFYGGLSTSTSVNSNSLYEYDIITKTVVLKGNSGTARYNCCGCIANDRIFIFGGTTNGEAPLNYFTEYNVTSNTWSDRPVNPEARQNGSLVYFNDAVYLIGAEVAVSDTYARKVWKYNLTSNTWADLAISIDESYSKFLKFTILNSELYVYDYMEESSHIKMSKWTIDTGFTEVIGPTLTPVPNFHSNNLTKLRFSTFHNSKNYCMCSVEGTIVDTANDYLIGEIIIANNEILPLGYPKLLIQTEVKAFPIEINRTDTPSKAKFLFTNLGSPDIIEVEIDYNDTTFTIEENETTGSFMITNTPVMTTNISTVQLAYKSTNSVYSEFSSLYTKP